MIPSQEPSTLHLCYNIKVDLSDQTFGHLVSDVVVCVFDLILMLVAIVANFLAIAAYKKTVVSQTPSNCLLMILSVFDILLAITAQPMFLVWKILKLANRFVCGLYLATHLAINLFGALSFLVASFLISLERYYIVFHPLVLGNNARKSFFKVAAVFAFFAWLLFVIGTFLGDFHLVYFATAVTVVTLCLLGTGVAYARIFREISRRSSARQVSLESGSVERRDRCREKKALVNMVFIIGAMTLLYAPIGGCAVYAMVIGRDWLYMNYFVPWAYLLVFTSAAVNPFLYGWENRGMRSSLKLFNFKSFKETGV